MSSSFPVFYIYVKHVSSEFTYIGTFPSRFVADDWWRAVSTSAHPSASHISRLTAQIYTMQSLSDIKGTLSDVTWAAQFRDRVFFTLINGVGASSFGVIPRDESRELVSGQAYFIRSRTDPTEFWHASTGAGIGVSKATKTAFIISRAEPNTDGSTMLLSDEVFIHSVESGYPVVHGAGDEAKIIKVASGIADAREKVKVKLEMFFKGGLWAQRGQFPGIEIREVGKAEAWELV